MPAFALLLLLTSASLHALWNLLLKRSQEKYIAMGWQVILSGVFAFFLLIFTGLPPRSMWLFAVISMLLEAVYFILLSNAYSDSDFSLVYPIARGTAPAFLMLWSILFLREKPTLGGVFGVSTIVCGMVIIGATSLLQNRGGKLHLKGVIVALAVALIISLYTLIDGTAVKNGPPLPYALTMFMLVPFLTTTYNVRRFGWKHFIAAWNGPRLPLIVAAVLGVIAYLLALLAYAFAPISYSGAIREVSVVIGAFLGWQFLDEKLGGTRVLGSMIIFAGILIIAVLG
ncbi:MAG TPA: DMT family transporter [Anaerolineales bacterium]|nr:DMT family transporter [Anaerolineales bacterium]HLO33792.1 DMT family transporter [Anaerolineales bacterium]